MTPPIPFVAGSTISIIAFCMICMVVLVAFFAAIGFTSPTRAESIRTLSLATTLLLLYAGLIVGVVHSGWLGNPFVPNGPIFLIASVSLAIALGFTSLGTRIMKGVSLPLLIGFQSFRLPLELVLHDWVSSGTIPETMTWTGSNWDIVAGILACIASPWAGNHRWLAWTFNIVGIVLLINVARVALLSSPIPWGWKVDPPLELILHLPYAFIVPFCVGGAALGHTLLSRRLLSSPSR